MGGKRALIIGVTGQDGAYLARLLLDKGYAVTGTSRDHLRASLAGLEHTGARDGVRVVSLAPNDFRSVYKVLREVRPDEIYNLSGQSSVALSFEQPMETYESIQGAVLTILECLRLMDHPVRFYNAASSECFGHTPEPADENSVFRPCSPYAIAKAAAAWTVATYREAYGLHACSGFLFNHESPLRPARFVTRKIAQAARRIAEGSGERLTLGNLSIRRDWGWAPEYVDAMWRMLQRPTAEDFVICTGHTHSLEDFLREAFACVGLDWRAHVDSDPGLLRPSDILESQGNPAKAHRLLGWRAEVGFAELVRRLVEG